MCGRYSLTHTSEEMARHYALSDIPRLAPRTNITPTEPILIIRNNLHSPPVREVAHVVWGLIPTWSDDPKIGARLINARAETAAIKPAFRQALRRRRCLIPMSAFYEWCKQAITQEIPVRRAAARPAPLRRKTPANQPHKAAAQPDLLADIDTLHEPASADNPDGQLTQIHSAEAAEPRTRIVIVNQAHSIHFPDNRIFSAAGIFEYWNGPNGEFIESASILTTAANSAVSHLHQRMPVLICPEHYELWLDQSVEDVTPLITAPRVAGELVTAACTIKRDR